MKLYQISPRRITIKEGASITAITVGTETSKKPSSRDRLFVVPVHIRSDNPSPDGWGVVSTMSWKPKIESDADFSPGYIARLTAFRGPGKQYGMILAHPDDPIALVGHGIASDSVLTQWDEAVVKTGYGARFLIMPTIGPDYILVMGEEEPHIDYVSVEKERDQFVRINDASILRWNHEKKKPRNT